MDRIAEQIEYTREELNTLIKNKEIITNDRELLELSVKSDGLINQYFHNPKRIVNNNSKL